MRTDEHGCTPLGEALVRLVFGGEARAIGFHKGDNIGPSRVQLVELGQVESDREAAKAIDGERAFLGDFQGEGARLVAFGDLSLKGFDLGHELGDSGFRRLGQVRKDAASKRNAIARSEDVRHGMLHRKCLD